jgi:dihydropyrimidine dehydrogenase (NAD+) subunit PreA
MANLSTTFAGIKTPNPFWLASAPPTDKEYNVVRAFKAGWGGVVWKTLGEQGPPVVNVSGPRYGAWHSQDRRVQGFNNIELITDRPLEVNLREIKQVKRAWPDRAMVVSLMVPCEEEAWKKILPFVEDTGADGIELNFGCPHGMSERGMGSAVGQVPEYVEMVARWCKQNTRMPVIVKLTPNISDIRKPAEAAKRGGADAVSLINTINSVMGVDLDAMSMSPHVGGLGTHGGYCGPAVKPIAMSMVSEIARNPVTHGLPISGIGGIESWSDAAQYIALGCGTVQVCTAAMVYGFKIVEEMIAGLEMWMDEKGYRSLDDWRGQAIPKVTDWQHLNLNYVVKAKIDQDACIKCGRCHIACEDTSHQAITNMVNGVRHFEVMEEECVGCNLCAVVCPVENCITMETKPEGYVDPRTGFAVKGFRTWKEHPNNPMAKERIPNNKVADAKSAHAADYEMEPAE